MAAIFYCFVNSRVWICLHFNFVFVFLQSSDFSNLFMKTSVLTGSIYFCLRRKLHCNVLTGNETFWILTKVQNKVKMCPNLGKPDWCKSSVPLHFLASLLPLYGSVMSISCDVQGSALIQRSLFLLSANGKNVQSYEQKIMSDSSYKMATKPQKNSFLPWLEVVVGKYWKWWGDSRGGTSW